MLDKCKTNVCTCSLYAHVNKSISIQKITHVKIDCLVYIKIEQNLRQTR